MTDAPRILDTLELWPDGAPDATGATDEDRPALTPVLPACESPSAAVIVCPGGGYCRRADHEGLPVARWLAANGVAGLVLRYRVKPYRHPVPLNDVLRAVRVARHHAKAWNLDAHRVGVLGFSAGGHLAISAATLYEEARLDEGDPVDGEPSRPDALIACYPVVTFQPAFRHTGSMKALLGEAPPDDLRDALSLELRVDDRTPPTFIWHTADDPAVPVENALKLAEALAGHSVTCALHVFAHGRHGLGLAEENPPVAAWPELAVAWLREIGF